MKKIDSFEQEEENKDKEQQELEPTPAADSLTKDMEFEARKRAFQSIRNAFGRK